MALLITVALVVALILAAIDVVEARGRAWTSIAVVIIAAVLLYGRLT